MNTSTRWVSPWLIGLSFALPLPASAASLAYQADAVSGYTLLAPLRSKETVLVDAAGEVVHRWVSDLTPGNAVELLPNGHLLRSAKVGNNPRFQGGGEGGRLEEFTWEGERVWTYELSSEDALLHHDFEVMPNGNILVLAWEGKTQAEALAAGRRPGSVSEKGLWPDVVLELKPTRPSGAEVVWRWAAWDHLVQNQGADLPGYGNPAEQLGRLDINIGAPALERAETEQERQERLETEARLAAMGYSGGSEDDEDDGGPAAGGQGGGRERDGADWMHSNSVDYSPELDLIVISARNFSEFLVIDHSTTTEQAAGSSGGRYGAGGEILMRWGNPGNSGLAGHGGQQLFGQHDARWTTESGRVAISVFNNGDGRPDGSYSSVEVIALPLTPDGKWVGDAGPGRAVGGKAAWSYRSDSDDFFSSHISGAVRLSADVMLVCDGEKGRIFQVGRDGNILQDYTIPKDLVALEEREGRGGRGRPERGQGGERERGEGRPEGGPEGRPERGRPPRGEGGPPPGGRGPGGEGERGGRGGPDGPGGGRRRGRGGEQGVSIFRAVYVPLDHPALGV